MLNFQTIIKSSILAITLTITLLYFYMRFKQRHNIILLQKEIIINYYYYFLYLFLITLLLIFCLLLLFFFKPKLTEKKQNKFFFNFIVWLKKINIFYKSYGIVFDFIGPNYTKYLIFFTRRFINWSRKKKLILILLHVVLPRMLIIFVLLFEIYHYKLQYYFYSLLLLLIPLIFRFFIFILTDIGPRLLPEFRDFLITETSDLVLKTPSGVKNVKAIGFKFKPENQDMDLDFFMVTWYYPMAYISGEMEINFLPLYYKITRITIFFYYIIHLLAWVYILFVI